MDIFGEKRIFSISIFQIIHSERSGYSNAWKVLFVKTPKQSSYSCFKKCRFIFSSFSFWVKLSWGNSFLLTFDTWRQLVNTLIMDEKNFYVKRENHGYHWNEVIWKTNFCCNFVKFLNCTLNFEYFEEKKKKKNEPRRFSIFQIIHSEKRDYLSAWNVLFVKILCSHLAHVWRKAHLV